MIDMDIGPAKHPGRTSHPRGYILLGLLVPFTVLTYLAVSSDAQGSTRDRPVILTTLATISGPFVGAIARNGQGCCLGASLALAAYCAPALAIGLAAQVVPFPLGRGRHVV